MTYLFSCLGSKECTSSLLVMLTSDILLSFTTHADASKSMNWATDKEFAGVHGRYDRWLNWWW